MTDERLNLTPCDFEIDDQGTIVLLYPQNDAAREWIDEHLYGDEGAPVQWFGGAVVIDHRPAQDIISALEAEFVLAQH